MIKRNKRIGYIKFADREETIIRMKLVDGVRDVYEIITTDGFYIYDMSEMSDDYRCRLYKQVVTEGRFQQTIKSELHVCEFEYIRIYNS